MELMHNQAIRILSGDLSGLYRVVLQETKINKTALVRLDPSDEEKVSRGGRKLKENPAKKRKKAPPPMLGKILWFNSTEIRNLQDSNEVILIETLLPNYKLSPSDEKSFEYRKTAMASFLDFEKLRSSLLENGNISALVKEASKDYSQAMIRKNFSLLCRFGFHDSSLRPTRSLNCGARGIPRPCDPNGRKKAGAKTKKQILLALAGQVLEPEQPGMSSDWSNLILAADSRIKTPKPSMPQRCIQILESHFVTKFIQIDGKLVAKELVGGEYPTPRQIRRVLEREYPSLDRLMDKTTQGHFDRTYRGISGSSRDGISGPSHTWAIDSTIGDVYLRSSIERAWIIGRPITYIIVDVWSTAIVGFYVCLTGPSWDMAKLALFSAVSSPSLIGELWGFEAMSSLYPHPTMCYTLMCDRGEYLSAAATVTGAKLIPCLSYAPPYRPDLKGIVEVLHRIEKDRQYFFVPGAIDQRRKEYELRKYDPTKSALTVQEYVAFLHIIFNEYNFTAPRENKLDVHMIAAGVHPSPAGLWAYGHKVGIGVRRSIPSNLLLNDLLPSEKSVVTKKGVRFLGMNYQSELIDEMQWSAQSRNFGAWSIDAKYFPGSVSRIWISNPLNPGLIELRLSEDSIASPELTFDEVLDAKTVGMMNNASVEHSRVKTALESHARANAIIEKAKLDTANADKNYSGEKPTISEARNMENNNLPNTPTQVQTPKPNTDDNSAQLAHQKLMRELYAAANLTGDIHG